LREQEPKKRAEAEAEGDEKVETEDAAKGRIEGKDSKDEHQKDRARANALGEVRADCMDLEISEMQLMELEGQSQLVFNMAHLEREGEQARREWGYEAIGHDAIGHEGMGASRTSLAWGRIRDVFVVDGKNGGGIRRGLELVSFKKANWTYVHALRKIQTHTRKETTCMRKRERESARLPATLPHPLAVFP